MHLGLQSVIVAFRIGACVWDASTRLGGTLNAAGQHPSWTAAIVGLTGEEVSESLKRFTEEKVCLHPKSWYKLCEVVRKNDEKKVVVDGVGVVWGFTATRHDFWWPSSVLHSFPLPLCLHLIFS